MPRICPLPTSLLLLTIACGPPGVGGESVADSTTSDATTGSTAGESSMSESGDSTSTMETTGPMFIPPHEDTGPVECDVFQQDCPEGEKCVPYGSTGGNWDAHKCVPVTGDQVPGGPCVWGGVVEATDDCDETSACWDVMDVDGQWIGICYPFCTGTADAPECPPKSSCLSASFTIGVCIFDCDPIAQDCSDGLGCYWGNGNFTCILTTEDLPAGQPCDYINECAAGLECLPAEVLPDCAGSACCSAFCDLAGGDDPCEAVLPGTACTSLFEENMAPPGYEHVGVCILPP